LDANDTQKCRTSYGQERESVLAEQINGYEYVQPPSMGCKIKSRTQMGTAFYP
jgi:hypothetical protein